MPSGMIRGVRKLSRNWLALTLLFLACLTAVRAETVAALPTPTSYVSDFANVIDPATKQQIESLCGQLDHEANAQIAVVTIHSLEGVAPEDFAVRLFEKWKIGPKGTDRGLLLLLAVNDRKWKIEVGYGLEGILNDAKTGDIGRSMVPLLQQAQYGPAVALGTQQLAQVVANDAHVTLTPIAQPRPRRAAQNTGGSILPFIVIALIVLFIVGSGAGGGPGGLFYFLLGSLLGGGGSDGRERDGHTGGWFGGGDGGGGGGGFGGFGGGGSGGGGSSGGW